MKPVIYPYKMGSWSSKALARALGALRVYPDRRYRPKSTHLIINWGSSHTPRWSNYVRNPDSLPNILNLPLNVAIASNKLHTFEILQLNAVSTPEWTTDYSLVIQWLQENPDLIVYGRASLTGHSGQGIKLIRAGEEVPQCPLYTKHLKYRNEYRVHVFNGEVIDMTQKKRRSGEEANPLIRNLANGWVFTREGMIVPDCVKEEAIKAVQALGLDFGAVDVAWNEYYNKAYIFEVNTACGLEGTTLQKYKEAIENYVSN